MRRFFRPFPLAVTALACLLLYTLVGFFLIPYVIKAHVLPAISEKLKRPVLAKEVEFSPFQLALRLTGFEIQENDHSPLIGFDEFFINVQAVSIVRRAYVFDKIRFAVPFVSVKMAKDGHVNLADLVPPDDPAEVSKPAKEPKAPAEIPAIQIGRLEIVQGVVEFRDDSKATPFSLDVVPINIALNNFHTKPGGDNTYSFTAELGKGEVLDWKGTISPEPIQSEGQLSLTGVKIPTLWQYIHDQFNFDVAAGTLQANGIYRLDTTTSPASLTLSDTSVHLADVALIERGEPEPVITVPSFKIDGIQVDLHRRTVSIASVAVTGATDRIWRNQDGTLNLQRMFTPAQTTPPASSGESQPPSSGSKEQPWSVTLKDARISNHTIHFEDRSFPLPAKIEVTGLSVKTHDVAVPITKPIFLTVEHKLNETGTVAVDGEVRVKPFQMDLTLGLHNIAIAPFQPYFEQFSRAAVESGAISLDGKVHVAVEHPKVPLLTFQGNLGMKGLAVTNRDDGSSVASLKHLQLRQIALAVDPTAVSIEEVGIDQPVVRLAVDADGKLNLSKLNSPATDISQPTPEPAPPGKKAASPTVAIKTVKLLKGSALFQDESITPAVRTGLYDLTGTIKGLSSKQVAKADVDIAGRVDKVAPLKIAGQINPLTEDAFTDLTVKFENVDLTASSPYSGKYAGYPIKKGKLFLDLAYKISQKQLEAENKVAIDQLTFGEKTESPDATSLPVPLAVALLKDRKGRIDIDLPISGNLSDPDFKYGRMVWSALLNLLTKIVASPFTLMSKLVPGGADGEELQFLAFEPGVVTLSDSEMKKIEALTKALGERPGLRLEITGTADPVRDRQALAYQKLHAQLLAKWRQGMGSSKEAELPSDEEARLVKELFEQQQAKQPASPSNVAQKPNVAPKPPTVEEMRQQLIAVMPMDEAGLRSLARQRAEQVHSQLVGEGKLTEERVFLTEVDVTATGQEAVRSKLAITVES